MKYLKMIGFISLYLLVYLFLQNYVAMFYLIPQLILNPFSSPTAVMDPVIKGTVPAIIIAALLSFLVYWFAFWLRKENIFKFCHFSRLSLKNVILVCIMGIALVFPVGFLVEYFKLDQLSKFTEATFESIFKNTSTLVLLLGVGIIGPMIEELIFRGLILNELKRNMKLPIAIIIQAFLFGVYHLNLTQGIYAFALGLLFGLVLVWTNSIWSTILIHIFFNSSSVIFSKLPNGEPEFLGNPVFLVVISMVSVLSIFLVVKNRKRELA